MTEAWITLPSGAHATVHDTGIIVQKVSESARICQAVLLTWDDVAKLVSLKRQAGWSRLLHGMRPPPPLTLHPEGGEQGGEDGCGATRASPISPFSLSPP